MNKLREGAIQSIYMENWMAYSGPVVLNAMPGVNIIAAANGCGKSAIVCAIALGLGFDLNVLSRGDNIRSFVKRGCSTAKLKLTLVDSSSHKGCTVVERTIVLSTNLPKNDVDVDFSEGETPKSKRKRKRPAADEDYSVEPKSKVVSPKAVSSVRNEWVINGKAATLDMVRQLHKKLNLQINNLLTFLAQANVGKFASMSQHELFRSTLAAIEPSLCSDLDQLIEMSSRLKSRQSEMKTLVNDLNCATVKISQLKVISETLSKMKDATLYSNLVKQRLYRIKLDNLDKGLKATKTRLKSRKEELKRSEEEKVMLDRKLKELTTETNRLLNDSRSKMSAAKKLNLLSSSRPGKHSSYAAVPLVDENVADRAYYDAMTALRTFAANNKPQTFSAKTSIVSRDVIEKRLEDVSKHIELLKMQITGENELAAEIAECRMNEEALKTSLRKIQNVSLRGYEDIQVDNLLRRLNSMKRDGYRQFLRWRREQVNAELKPTSDSTTQDSSTEEVDETLALRRLPKLIVSDMKVQGRLNCCIIEEALNKYIDCVMLPKDSKLSLLSLVNKFKLPSVTIPDSQPVLCKVTERMRKFGVKHFLHELVECTDPDTKHTISSIAQLGTSFVVDEDIFRGWIENAETAHLYGGDELDLKEEGYGDSHDRCRQSVVESDSDHVSTQPSLPDLNNDAATNLKGNENAIVKQTSSQSKQENNDGNRVLRRQRSKQAEAVVYNSHGANTPNNASQQSDSGDKIPSKVHGTSEQINDVDVKSSNTRPQKTAQGNRHNREDQHSYENSQTSSQRVEESHFRRFYSCMVDEISKQVGRKVQILRYYVGTKRHIYRVFKDAEELYSDYAVEIHTTSTILYDCSQSKTEDVSNMSKVEQELKDVTDRLRVLGGMLYGRKQDNKAVGGRLYALNREQLSLERTLKAIDGAPTGGRSSVKRKEELETMQKQQKEDIVRAIGKRGDRIMEWIEKASSRRTKLIDARELFSQYRSKKQRKDRLEELAKISTTTYNEVKTDFTRLQDTLSQQETKYKQYARDISELNILIKAISGEIVSSTLDEGLPNTNREREALRVRQEAAAKLDSMAEGDLERELQIAELNVRQLERDDCEEAQTAKEMRDEIIREKKLSNDIAEADAGIKDLTQERLKLYEKWISRVTNLISEVDGKFGCYMREIGPGAAGQVRLEASLESIKDAKLRVLVKFHGDKDLLPLAASYQSGGERGVTTMVYILAVQHLTSNPFFVIDEINQGLDSNYETRLMGLLLCNNMNATACENSGNTTDANGRPDDGTGPSPQYFVLTPQLLPGVNLRGATLHFPLNGTGVVNGLSI